MNFSGWRGFAVCCFLLLALPAALAHAEPSRIARPDGIDDASWASLKRAIGATVIEAKLAAEAGAEGDRMGYAIALEGDTALVAARYDDFAGAVDRGSVYVFTRSGTSWSQQAKLVAGDGAENDEFGTSVALSGNTAVVGAVFDDVGANADQGSVYVFTRTGTIWTQQAKLTAADGAAGDRFGASVAASGDTVLVGAWSDAVGATGAAMSVTAIPRRADGRRVAALHERLRADHPRVPLAVGGQFQHVGPPPCVRLGHLIAPAAYTLAQELAGR